MKPILTAASLSLMLATSSVASAQGSVHFATCTRPGVEHGCVLADSGGTTYNVTAAGVGPYKWLQGTGVVVNKVSYCMQGKIVDHFVPDKAQALVGCVSQHIKKP